MTAKIGKILIQDTRSAFPGRNYSEQVMKEPKQLIGRILLRQAESHLDSETRGSSRIGVRDLRFVDGSLKIRLQG